MRTPQAFRPLAVTILTITLAALGAAQTASFQGLGQMPGAMSGAGTFPQAISADHSTIIGWAWVCPSGQPKCTSSDKTEAFRWTAAGKYQVLGDLGNSIGSIAFATSTDGSVVVGQAPAGTNSFGAFRWTAAQGMQAIPLPMLFAYAVTADGMMAAGGDNWWNTSGQSGIFGPFPGNQDQTQATGLAGTAQAPVAVGAALKGAGPFGPTLHAFRWTLAGGLQDLGLTTGDQSIALAISADEKVIVGEATDASGFWRAFRWTASTGMQDIGTLGGPESKAYSVNRDGTVIVGTSLTSGSTGSNHAFRWTPTTGMQDLRTLLQAAGVTGANNWVSIDTAASVSADGAVIAGFGLNPRTTKFPFGVWTPFRVVLPVP
jgi:probable HAF family extracellular repeat protein